MEPNHELRLSYDFPDSVLTRVCIAEGPQRMPFCLTFGRRWECGLLQAESLAHARTYSRGDMSESRIDDLNPEQLRAATAGEEGAGTGRVRPRLLRRGWPHVYAQGFGRDVAPGQGALGEAESRTSGTVRGGTAFLALRV